MTTRTKRQRTIAVMVIVLKLSPLQWERSIWIYHEIATGDFEPQIVKKNQTDISNIEDQVLSMYAKGMTTRDISAHLKECLRCGCIRRNDITYDRSNPFLSRKRMAKPAAGKKICHCFYGCGTFPCSGGQSNGKKGSLRCYRC